MKKAVAPLLKFLKTTGIGGREGARERELEWERKKDQAGENRTWINSGGDNPKVALTYSGKIKQKWEKQGG